MANDIKKAKNYFNEEEFRLFIKEYQNTTIIRNNKPIIKNEILENKLVKSVAKIINAIIMVYRYHVFEDFDDLKQHAMEACYKNFLKFNPEKGTAFNFFSIIAKISLLNYTDRRKKHRNHQNIEEQLSLEGKEYTNYDFILDNLENVFDSIIDQNYIGTKRKKYIKIAALLINYLRKTRKFVSKSDLYSWCRSYGIKNTEVREFIKDIKKYNEKIFEGVK
jgi:hypothetical protein